jgi:chromate reductase, NAD(P)H dehydrogenase (quinone)
VTEEVECFDADDSFMKLIALNGSLRRGSSNAALLRAARDAAPPGVSVQLYEALASIPPFNPDLDEVGDEVPEAVEALRRLLIGCDGVIVSTPEYAHGLPGSLKNLLDWLVSTGELVGKPVVTFNAAAAGGAFAQDSLHETLRTMNWRVIEEACLSEPFVERRIVGQLTEPGAVSQLRTAMEKFVSAIEAVRADLSN